MREREIRRGRFHARSVILGHIRRTSGALVSHEERTTIDIEVRTQFLDRSLIDLMTIERAANGLRYAMSHSLALGLLGQKRLALAQRFFRMLALGEVAPDSLHADRFAVIEDQTRADFEPDSFALLRDDIDFVNSRDALARLLRHHVAREV